MRQSNTAIYVKAASYNSGYGVFNAYIAIDILCMLYTKMTAYD